MTNYLEILHNVEDQYEEKPEYENWWEKMYSKGEQQ